MQLFKKNHLQIKFYKNNFINKVIQGQFCVYFLNSGLMQWIEYKALRFFFKKRFKVFSKKLFFRITPKFKNTKKSIGIRMGKGKGSLNEYYFLIKKGQLFFEFGFKKKFKKYKPYRRLLLLEHFNKTIFLASLKIKIKMQLFRNIK